MTKTDKVYKFIGQAVVIIAGNAMWAGLMVLGFMGNTIY